MKWKDITQSDRMTIVGGIAAIAIWFYYRGRKYL
jgi:hypothetical protein